MPSPNLIASALARRTTDTAICVMGNSLALYNPPTRVAEEFAMIDCISGGRLIAGFPVGTPMDTCYAYGQNPSQLRERYLEAHDLVMKAWTEKETFAFNGRFNQQRYVNIWPRPIQQPHPPIWIPGGGSVETWQWCAEMDYVYCYLSYFGYKAGAGDDGRLLGRDGAARQGPQSRTAPASSSSSASPRAASRRSTSTANRPSISTAAACTSIRASPLPPGYVDRGDAARRHREPGRWREAAASASERRRAAGLATRHGGHRRRRLRHHRHARRGGRAAARGGDQPQCRPPDAAAAVRQHEQGHRKYNTQLFAEKVMPQAEGPVRRVGGPLVAASRSAQRAALPAFRPQRPPSEAMPRRTDRSPRPPAPRSLERRVTEPERRPSRSTAFPPASGARAAGPSSASSPASAACRAGCPSSTSWPRRAR